MSTKDAFVAALPEDDLLIKNPDNPSHVMVVKPVARTVRVERNGVELAQSTNAVRVMEIGRSVYDPMIYLPEADLKMAMEKTEKSTHCPLKGDAYYLAHEGEEVAWGYHPLPFAQVLEGHVAFWPNKVRLTEGD